MGSRVATTGDFARNLEGRRAVRENCNPFARRQSTVPAHARLRGDSPSRTASTLNHVRVADIEFSRARGASVCLYFEAPATEALGGARAPSVAAARPLVALAASRPVRRRGGAARDTVRVRGSVHDSGSGSRLACAKACAVAAGARGGGRGGVGQVPRQGRLRPRRRPRLACEHRQARVRRRRSVRLS